MSWKICSLSDVCSVLNGSTPSRKNREYWENGSINWFTIEDIRKFGRIINKTNQYVTEKALKETSLKLIPINSVLLCCTASVGEYAITKIPLTMNQQFNALVTNKNELLPEFLFYYCSTIKKKLISLSATTTFDFISAGKLKKIKISYPSLIIQQKIVAKLDKIFAKIDKAIVLAETNIKNIEDFFQSYLEKIYNNEHFTKKKICEIAKIKGGKRIPKGFNLKTEKTPYVYLRVKSFTESGEIDNSELRYVDAEVKNLIKNYIINSEDLYISIAGTIGRTGIVSKEFSGSLLTENACRLVFEKNINNKFVYYFTKSPSFKSQLIEQTRTTAQPKLALHRLGNIKLIIPNLKEQFMIVEGVERMNFFVTSNQNKYISKINELKSLKQSILQQAFNGELVKAA
jgi:type I restriction enzyme S subunit